MLSWFTCLLLGLTGIAEFPVIDSALVNYRERHFVRSDRDTGLIFHYLEIRQQNQLDSCVHMQHGHSPREEVLSLIYHGHCDLYGPGKSESKAYQHYLTALAKCEQYELKILEIECLRSLIRYGLLTKNNLDELKTFIERHRMLAYDRLEELQNTYFQMRYQAERSYLSKGSIGYEKNKWLTVIRECHESGYHFLETELRGLFALILELDDKMDLALEQYQEALLAAGKFSPDFYEKKKFISYSNIGLAYLNRQQYSKALPFLKESLHRLKSEPLSNQILVYQWIARAYHHLNHNDSAYYFLDLGYRLKEEEAGLQKAIAVKEIQSKYDNERLGRALAEESARRKQNNLTAFLTGGSLLLISLFIWFHYYRQRRKTQEIKQALVIANKEIQLTAVNARLDGQEQEKKDLAHYLHDHIVGQLVAATMHLKVAAKNGEEESIQKSAQLIHQAGLQLRNKSHDLYPPVLMKLGLGPALQDLCKKYSNPFLTFQINPEANNFRIKGDAATKIYFSAQELFNNITKHSQASKCLISMQLQENVMILEFEDNGHGLVSQVNSAEGLGLHTVKARIENLDGSFIVKENSSGGLLQKIIVPRSSLIN